jgi:hypothetical protein
VTNDINSAILIKKKVMEFLKVRGLIINKTKSFVKHWLHNTKFDFLGFTFHYVWNLNKKFKTIVRVSKLKNFTVNKSLQVYPNNLSIKQFKEKIKKICRKNINISANCLVNVLNVMIQNWVNFFCSGNLKTFFRLDFLIRNWV